MGECFKKCRKQTGAELCQAQLKLGLAVLDLLDKKFRLSLLEVILHLKRTMSSYIDKIEVVFFL